MRKVRILSGKRKRGFELWIDEEPHILLVDFDKKQVAIIPATVFAGDYLTTESYGTFQRTNSFAIAKRRLDTGDEDYTSLPFLGEASFGKEGSKIEVLEKPGENDMNYNPTILPIFFKKLGNKVIRAEEK